MSAPSPASSGPGSPPAADRRAALDAARAAASRHEGELERLIRIPSVSAAPAPAVAVRDSADAVADLLVRSGLDRVRQASIAGSHPYVIGEWTHRPDAPTVLLYAHHDVQPPGIVANWTSDPFTPRREADRLFGRGSADDKAGAVAHAAVVSAWLAAAGELPCNVKILIEGEEEIGSPHLEAFLGAHADELAADVLVLADAGNWTVGTPGITYALRGLVGLDVSVRALSGPVHSGLAGGVVPDPVLALARALASLVDDHGDIAVAGFADDVRPLTAVERARLAALDDGTAASAGAAGAGAAAGAERGVRRAFGVVDGADLAGDPERTVWERLWFRPSLTVIGFDSHPIAGSSNQVVAVASARLSIRLAPGQDPARAAALVGDHLRAHVPWGLEVALTPTEAVPAWVCEPEGWAFEAAERALTAGFGKPPVYMGIGGSIPFVGPFAAAFGGIPALLLGPADPRSAIHGEDESVHLPDWHRLVASEIHLLAELAESAGAAESVGPAGSDGPPAPRR
jgi:acetylornithine deacetylase/succinyl-diaminopimelate desuccinylase-like protein